MANADATRLDGVVERTESYPSPRVDFLLSRVCLWLARLVGDGLPGASATGTHAACNQSTKQEVSDKIN